MVCFIVYDDNDADALPFVDQANLKLHMKHLLTVPINIPYLDRPPQKVVTNNLF